MQSSTAISIEDGGTQEQVFEKLKLHKEVLNGVKEEPWPLRKKMKLVRQAKLYVRKHEGVLQERLAQNRSTKDVIARVSLLITKVIKIRFDYIKMTFSWIKFHHSILSFIVEINIAKKFN